MTLSNLLEEFNVVIDTNEGLTELRSLILGLAVRGKLISQNNNESSTYPFQDYDEVPFEIPSTWNWVKLGDGIEVQRGGSPRPIKSFITEDPDGINWIKIGDATEGSKYIYETKEKIRKEGVGKSRFVTEGDFLLSNSMSFGKPYILKTEGCIHDGWLVLSSFEEVFESDYLYHLLNSSFAYSQFDNLASGSTVRNLNKGLVSSIFIPAPPLSEQHRIVQKIESLFAEVDELEVKLNRQGKLDEKLQLAVNADVQQAPDAEASKSAWIFITTNFETLYHTPEAIDNLKKNILNEAVRGRLVPQNLNDEPATELLRKIGAEKQRLYEEGKIRKPKNLPPIDEEDISFEIPESWEWCRFGNLASTVEYGTSQKAHKEPNGVPVLRMGNIGENGNMSFHNLKYVEEDIKDLPRLYLKNDDLVFNRTNSYELVGKMGLYKEREEKFTLASYLIRSTLLSDIYPEYIHYYFNSLHCRVNEIEPEITKQTNQANFNGTKLQHVRVPLPAKEEQHRIVRRIEELFDICDQFKAQLKQREKVNERLVKGLVKEVLENSNQ